MSVSIVNIVIIAATLALVLGITIVGMRIARWRRDVKLRKHGAPMLVMPTAVEAGGAPRPVLTRDVSARQRAIRPSEMATAPHGTEVIPASGSAVGTSGDEGATVRTGPFRPGDVLPGSPSAHLVSGASLRYFRAEEGTLEFLPGSLEVVEGDDVGQEIRFARQHGDGPAVVTFGRAEGPPLRHVQLLDPTVSRQHAELRWDGNGWRLTNLSSTNAVIFNGSALDLHRLTEPLAEGDRIEMGAVTFVFHKR